MPAGDPALPERPVTVLIAALGGEGGGVLANWLLAAADACDFPVQSTSIPGVAQRTGATTYYLEVYPVAFARLGESRPVFALTPSPGNVDLMAASELVEAGRALQNGYVTPERTTLVASTHRVYATSEKLAAGDGRFPAERVMEAALHGARRPILFDMAALAEASGTIINAVLFGAMAASGALPFPREACEQAIRGEGKGGEASLLGFAAGFEHARRIASGQPVQATDVAQPDRAIAGGQPAPASREVEAVAGASAPLPDVLRAAIGRLPENARAMAGHGVRRVLDYQDRAYADLYLARLARVAGLEAQGGGDGSVAAETARYLALWMSYEDVIRVADLKSRAERLERVRREVRAAPEEPVRVIEYLKPGSDEIASLLPAGLARIVRRIGAGPRGDRLSRAVHLQTTSIGGYLALRLMAALRPLRRRSSRFAAEQAAIERWLAQVCDALPRSPSLAREIVESARLLKGYGETHERGRASFDRVLSALLAGDHADDAARAEAIREAREAALAAATASTGRPPAAAGSASVRPLVRMDRPGR